MNVYLITTQARDAMGPSNDTIWITKALAQAHIEKKAKALAMSLAADLTVQSQYRIDYSADVTYVEVKTREGDWRIHTRYYLAEEVVRGDAVDALAEIVS